MCVCVCEKCLVINRFIYASGSQNAGLLGSDSEYGAIKRPGDARTLCQSGADVQWIPEALSRALREAQLVT